MVFHVAAHPGRKAQKVWQPEAPRLLAEDVQRCILDVFVEGGDDAIKNVGQEKQHVLQFVGDRHSLRRVFVGLPPCRHFQPYVGEARTLLLHRHRRVQHVDKAAHDVLLFAQYGSAGRFGRVRRENWLEVQGIEYFLECIDIQTGCFQPHQHVFETSGLILEIGRETANDFRREIGFLAFDQVDQAFSRTIIAFASADGSYPGGLDEIEKILTALFADKRANEFPERADVLAERPVLVLEDNVLAAQTHVGRLLGAATVHGFSAGRRLSRGSFRTAAAGRRLLRAASR